MSEESSIRCIQWTTTAKQMKMRKMRDHSWTFQQQIQYVNFLREYQHLMDSAASRKTNRVFKLMAGFVRTRSSVQAKSHHQKLQEKYKTIPGIISHLSSLIEQTRLKQTLRTSTTPTLPKKCEDRSEVGREQMEDLIQGGETVLITKAQGFVAQNTQTDFCQIEEYSVNYVEIGGGVAVIDLFQSLI